MQMPQVHSNSCKHRARNSERLFYSATSRSETRKRGQREKKPTEIQRYEALFLKVIWSTSFTADHWSWCCVK